MEIILHTTDCPQCKILESKLHEKNIAFTKNYDTEVMLNMGMMSAPGLQIDGKTPLTFPAAVKWVNSQ